MLLLIGASLLAQPELRERVAKVEEKIGPIERRVTNTEGELELNRSWAQEVTEATATLRAEVDPEAKSKAAALETRQNILWGIVSFLGVSIGALEVKRLFGVRREERNAGASG